jgi:hypothetical protein
LTFIRRSHDARGLAIMRVLQSATVEMFCGPPIEDIAVGRLDEGIARIG